MYERIAQLDLFAEANTPATVESLLVDAPVVDEAAPSLPAPAAEVIDPDAAFRAWLWRNIAPLVDARSRADVRKAYRIVPTVNSVVRIAIALRDGRQPYYGLSWSRHEATLVACVAYLEREHGWKLDVLVNSFAR